MVNFLDCFGVFLVATGIKILCALRIDLYHSTDFDVHRNWLAITHQEELESWYYESTSEWTLDYPPFFAFFQKALSSLAAKVDPLLVKINKDPISSPSVVLFQKASVIVTDLFVLLGCYCYGKALGLGNDSRFSFPAMIVANFGLFLLDHLHFQYNGMLLGISLILIAALVTKRFKTAAFIFTSMLHLKHLFLYVAPLVGIVMLQSCNEQRISGGFSSGLKSLLALGMIVFGTSALSLFPFRHHLSQLLSRLFPFKRGLTHTYWAGNVWALYNLADWLLSKLAGVKSNLTSGLVGEFTFQSLPPVSPLVCAILTLLAILPAMAKVFRTPSATNTISGYCICGLAAFLFGWHVHEKAIMLSLLPLTGLLFSDTATFFRPFIMLSVSGLSGLLPLIYTQFEQVIVIGCYFLFVLTILHLYRAQFKSLHLLEKAYVTATFPIAAYVQIWSHITNPGLPFLALIVQSSYSALGVIYSFLSLNFILLSKQKQQ